MADNPATSELIDDSQQEKSIDDQLKDLLEDIESSIEDLDPLGDLERAAAAAMEQSDAGDPMNGLVELELAEDAVVDDTPSSESDSEAQPSDDQQAEEPAEATADAIADVDVDLDGIDDLLSETTEVLEGNASDEAEQPADLGDVADQVVAAASEPAEEDPADEEAAMEAALRDQLNAAASDDSSASTDDEDTEVSDEEAAMQAALRQQIEESQSANPEDEEAAMEAALRDQLNAAASDDSSASTDDEDTEVSDEEAAMQAALRQQIEESQSANPEDEEAAMEEALREQVEASAVAADVAAAAADDEEQAMLEALQQQVEDASSQEPAHTTDEALGTSSSEEGLIPNDADESGLLEAVEEAIRIATSEFEQMVEEGNQSPQPDFEAMVSEAESGAEPTDEQEATEQDAPELPEADIASEAAAAVEALESDEDQSESAAGVAPPPSVDEVVEDVIEEHGITEAPSPDDAQSNDTQSDADAASNGSDSSEQVLEPATGPEASTGANPESSTDQAAEPETEAVLQSEVAEEPTPAASTTSKQKQAKPPFHFRMLETIAFPIRFIPESKRSLFNAFIIATCGNAALVWLLVITGG